MKYNLEETVNLIKNKLNNNSFLTYKEIATITGYHPKYILKLKKDILNNKLSLIHGNKNKRAHNSIPISEEQKIIKLYKRSNASVEKFVKFYGTRSYSCIYNVLKRNGLLNKTK